MVWKYILSAVIGYLIGGVSFGYLAGKIFRGKDIRKVGSGNPGTANAIRNYGWGVGVFTFVGDVVKGITAALIGLWLCGDVSAFFENWSVMGLSGEICCYIGGLSAVIGHIWPVFLKFKGGKGVATTFGVFLVIMPLYTLIAFGICIIIIAFTKTMSIGSLVGTALMTIASFALYPWNWWLQGTCVILFILVYYSHRANLKRLAEGKENQL